MKRTPVVRLSPEKGYQFNVDFGLDGVPTILTDATPPIGRAIGPDSEQLLVAAVGSCLSASLLFFLRKFKNDDVSVRAAAAANLRENEQGRLRVHSIDVVLHLSSPASSLRMLERALSQYEDFCVVTQSIRTSIPVSVAIYDAGGRVLTP